MNNEKWFVIGRNGLKYGPADLLTLQRWTDEGRVTPQTLLEEAISGQRLLASALVDLTFRSGAASANPWATPPAAPPYPHAGYYAPQTTTPGDGDLTAAWMLMILAFVVCAPLVLLAIYFAHKARSAGNPRGQAAFLVSIVLAAVWAVAALAGKAIYGCLIIPCIMCC
ncbi:MAG: hypothetical protein C4341_07660 [Armatimonadota bacterium]